MDSQTERTRKLKERMDQKTKRVSNEIQKQLTNGWMNERTN